MNKLGIIALCILVYAISYNIGQTDERKRTHKDTITVLDTVYIIKNDNVKDTLFGNPKDHLYNVLVHCGIKYPETAYAIAVQETGWFTSELCTKHNNLFGLYDSKHKQYYHFKTWYESVIAYRDLVEKKYDGEEHYLQYLSKLPYSEDKNYISKIKTLINQNKKSKQ